MAYKPLCKDLTESTRQCDFCPNMLTSLKAYILEDDLTGVIKYAGPICAKSNIGANYSLVGVPDLTEYTRSQATRASSGGGGGGSAGGRISSQQALEYLVLRENKLASVMSTSYHVLHGYYQKSKAHSLTASDIQHILNLESKAPAMFKLQRLQKCYNYLFWIDVAISNLVVEKAEFLLAIRASLLKTGSLSAGALKAVNNWLINIPGVPQLR